MRSSLSLTVSISPSSPAARGRWDQWECAIHKHGDTVGSSAFPSRQRIGVASEYLAAAVQKAWSRWVNSVSGPVVGVARPSSSL